MGRVIAGSLTTSQLQFYDTTFAGEAECCFSRAARMFQRTRTALIVAAIGSDAAEELTVQPPNRDGDPEW
jgi:hypothetical protein